MGDWSRSEHVAALLSLPGADEPGSETGKLAALAFAAVAFPGIELLYDGKFAFGFVVTACAAATLWTPARRWACLVAMLIMSGALIGTFPLIPNHAYLILILLIVLSLLDPGDEDEARLGLQAARWLVVLVFFWSGVKKLVFGTYLHGEYFAFAIATLPKFADFFSLLLPSSEIARLQEMGGAVGSGPYQLPAIGVLLSNAVWISEIGVAIALLTPRLAGIAWVAGVVLMAGIEFAARELFFGLLFTTILLCFPAAPLVRRAVGVFVTLLVALTLAKHLAGLAVPYLT